MSVLGNNIRYLRKKLKLSQEALAAEVGAKRANIDTYERGIANPKAEIENNICKFFAISIEDLRNRDLSKQGGMNVESGFTGKQTNNGKREPQDRDTLLQMKTILTRYRDMIDSPPMSEEAHVEYLGVALKMPTPEILANLMFRVDSLEEYLNQKRT